MWYFLSKILIWEFIWKYILERNHLNVINVLRLSHSLLVYHSIWVHALEINHINTHKPYKDTLDINHSNVINCDTAVIQSNELSYHMRGHTGEKLFQCSKCEMLFSQNYKVTIHIEIHSGEKPFKFNQCNRAFTQSAGLSHHMSTHSGDNPYDYW